FPFSAMAVRIQASGGGPQFPKSAPVPDRAGPHAEIFFRQIAFRRANADLIEASMQFFPIRSTKTMARPSYRATAKKRHDVMLLTATGMSRRDIAICLNIDVATLEKHFARELVEGPAVIRKELRAFATAAAIEGKAWAMKLLHKMTRDD